MRRLLLLLLVAILAVAVVGVLLMGAFPPRVARQPVEHIVPNQRFQQGP
jgi:hypothetical protein